MNKKSLLFAAATALMCGACSDDINNPGDGNTPSQVVNSLTLTKLDPATQAGRVSVPSQSRGLKANRLQLVAKIAPVAESMAAEHNWSATGITISGGNAYVSWHSNHQAKVPADKWGGAIDVIDIAALKAGERNNVVTNSYMTQAVKFNNIVAGTESGVFYLPVTSYSNGAVVGRWAAGTLAMDTISVPGSSANAISVGTNDLYVATGYKGGVYSVPVDFDTDTEFGTVVEYSATFGGKYIDGGYLLRTDDSECEIRSLVSDFSITGAPLVSAEKNAEIYDGETGEWDVKENSDATHYGKHTMAVDQYGGYIYVGGGKGANGVNGLRVYDETGVKWQNGTNTNAVCIDGDYVYAATGAGLRVYEKFNGTELPLYAFEVLDYDADGNAADHPGLNYPEAGTDAHSPNFVAVGEGLIFVACGQSGVYVFRLNHDATSGKIAVSLSIPAIESLQKDEIDEDDEDGTTFTIPKRTPTPPDGKEFAGWSEDENATEPTYQPEDEVPVTPQKPNVVLYPVYKDKAPTYSFTVTFDIEADATGATGTTPDTIEFEDLTSAQYTVTMPGQGNIVREGFDFKGWFDKPNNQQSIDDEIYEAGKEYTFTENKTFYPVWSKKVTTGGGEGGQGEDA